MQAAAGLSPSYRRFILIALAVLLAVWGEWALFTQRIVLDGVVLFSAAAALFGLLVLPRQRLVRPVAQQVGVLSRDRLKLSSVQTPLLAALTCTILAWNFSDANRFRPETLVFWFLACGLYFWAFWDRSGQGPSLVDRLGALTHGSIALSWSTIGLVAVILVAAFFRYYQIGTIPAEMTSDHSEKLMDVRDVMNGQYRIFFPRNTGREPLQFYMAVPFAMWVGLGHLALKLLTATMSLLTVPIAYLIGKEIGGWRFGLLAAFFLAVSKWDVGIGRMGLRFPYYPFFAALSFYFLLRALRYGRRNDYLLCGLATGIGLYGYMPFRVMPALIVAAVVLKILFELRQGWRHHLVTLRNTALSLGAIAMVLIPLARYIADNPQSFWFRALTRVSNLETAVAPNPLSVLLSNLVNGLLMFNWRGDAVWITTMPGDPALDFVSGGLFLLGVVWCIYSLIRHREPVAAYLLLALLVFLGPSVTSIAFPGENPSLSRSGANTFIAALLVAAPVYLTAKRMSEAWSDRTGRWVVAGMLIVLLALVARVNYDRYFHDFAPSYRQSARNSSEMAAVIKAFDASIGSRQNAYLKDWPHWVDTRNIGFNMDAPDWWTTNILYKPEDVTNHKPPPGNKLYLLNKQDKDAVQRLQQRYPEGQLTEQRAAVPGQEFLMFFVPERN